MPEFYRTKKTKTPNHKRQPRTPKSTTLTGKQPTHKMTTITIRIPKSMKKKLQKKADRYTKGKLSMIVRHALLEELK